MCKFTIQNLFFAPKRYITQISMDEFKNKYISFVNFLTNSFCSVVYTNIHKRLYWWEEKDQQLRLSEEVFYNKALLTLSMAESEL